MHIRSRNILSKRLQDAYSITALHNSKLLFRRDVYLPWLLDVLNSWGICDGWQHLPFQWGIVVSFVNPWHWKLNKIQSLQRIPELRFLAEKDG